MSSFIVITQDTLKLLTDGKQGNATTRITDLESAWDNASSILKRRNADEWHAVDGKIGVPGKSRWCQPLRTHLLACRVCWVTTATAHIDRSCVGRA